MKVILNDFVNKLGNPGDEVEVKPGYARNYLIPQRLALIASKANKITFENNRKQRSRKLARILSEATEQKEKLESIKELIFLKKAGNLGKLFGSVTSSDIATALNDKGFPIDKKQINLDAPLKILGSHNIKISLFQGVQADLSILVKNEDEKKQPPKEGEDSDDGAVIDDPDGEQTDSDLTETQVEPGTAQ